MNQNIQCVAFNGTQQIAAGDLREVALKAHKTGSTAVLIFDDVTSELIDLNLSLPPRDLLRQLESAAPQAPAPVEEPRSPGRPKLGVIPREVTLLPRHWEWLNLQPGGASVALRKLVEEARRVNRSTDRVRRAKEATYRFVSAMAGNETGFEEATRALFAGDGVRFAQHSQTWPKDVREHAAKLAARVFQGSESHS